MDVKVSSKSNPSSVAGMIANLIKDGQEKVKVSCVGAGALNQSVKAIAIARGYVAPLGYDLMCVPSFKQIELDGMTRTALQLVVEVR